MQMLNLLVQIVSLLKSNSTINGWTCLALAWAIVVSCCAIANESHCWALALAAIHIPALVRGTTVRRSFAGLTCAGRHIPISFSRTATSRSNTLNDFITFTRRRIPQSLDSASWCRSYTFLATASCLIILGPINALEGFRRTLTSTSFIVPALPIWLASLSHALLAFATLIIVLGPLKTDKIGHRALAWTEIWIPLGLWRFTASYWLLARICTIWSNPSICRRRNSMFAVFCINSWEAISIASTCTYYHCKMRY